MKLLSTLALVCTMLTANAWKKDPNQICIQHYPKYQMKISFQELCDFGKVGCKKTPKVKQINVFCDEENVSSCFLKKQWQTANQYIKISEAVRVKGTSKLITYINKKYSEQFCVKTTNKKPIMSHEKFEAYKKMTPQILGIMNKELSKDVQCLKEEASEQNVKACISKNGKSLEYMLFKIMPDKFYEICTTKKETVRYFTWNKKNYNTVITELKKTIKKNKRNKNCLEGSSTVEAYTKCLTATKP